MVLNWKFWKQVIEHKKFLTNKIWTFALKNLFCSLMCFLLMNCSGRGRKFLFKQF